MRLLLFLCAACLAGAAEGGRVEFTAVKRDVIEERLGRLFQKTEQRRQALAAVFQEAGCANVAQEPLRRTKFPNVVCSFDGPGEAVIVVGAHYDLASIGKGAVDNWSGASLLPSLYQAIASRPRRHRFVFAGFSSEEIGLVGSREYVKTLSKEQRRNIKAYVNLDCLGLGPASVWLSHADRKLADAYARVAHAVNYPAIAVNVEQVGSDDSMSFRDAGIPVISLHSVTQRNWRVLHSSRDTLDAIRKDDYFESYRMLCALLAYLDQTLE